MKGKEDGGSERDREKRRSMGEFLGATEEEGKRQITAIVELAMK